MEDIYSVEFTVLDDFPWGSLFRQIDAFLIWTIKGRALCFSAKKSTVRVFI